MDISFKEKQGLSDFLLKNKSIHMKNIVKSMSTKQGGDTTLTVQKPIRSFQNNNMAHSLMSKRSKGAHL